MLRLLTDGVEDKSPIYNLLPPDAIHRATDCYSLETAYAMSDAFIHDTRPMVSSGLNTAGMIYTTIDPR